MTEGFANPIIGGGGGLVYPSIHSPDFVSGSSGWSVNKDGSAEFNDITVNSGLDLNYSPHPGAGNLISSDAPAAGTDRYGNAYLAGRTVYSLTGGLTALNLNAGALTLWTAPSEAGPWTLQVAAGLSRIVPGPSFLQISQGGLALGAPLEFWLLPSNDNTGNTDAANLNAILTTGAAGGPCIVHLIAGTYYLNASVTLSIGQYLKGAGRSASTINLVNSAAVPAIILGNTTGTYQAAVPAGLSGFTVNVSNAPAGSTGIQAGDICGLAFYDVAVHVGSSGNTGFHFINLNYQTEQLHGDIYAQGIGNLVVFDMGGNLTSNGSFDRPALNIWLNGGAGANGVIFQNGAIYIGGRGLGIFGNMVAGGPGGNAVLTLTGSSPAGHAPATVSSIGGSGNPSPLFIDVELDGAGAAPQTINAGPSNSINATGVLNFNGGFAFAQSNIQGRFKWQGSAPSGDPTLVETISTGSYLHPAGTLGTLRSQFGGTLLINPGAAVAGGIMQPGSFDGQEVTVVNESASFSYTFAVAGTSNVADGVSDVINPLTAARYKWVAATALWYRG